VGCSDHGQKVGSLMAGMVERIIEGCLNQPGIISRLVEQFGGLLYHLAVNMARQGYKGLSEVVQVVRGLWCREPLERRESGLALSVGGRRAGIERVFCPLGTRVLRVGVIGVGGVRKALAARVLFAGRAAGGAAVGELISKYDGEYKQDYGREKHRTTD
ncbi:MAG: hypothetical protein JSW59_06050, partial [Phycisphaerales bacterium]